jgi:hypothetical protein
MDTRRSVFVLTYSMFVQRFVRICYDYTEQLAALAGCKFSTDLFPDPESGFKISKLFRIFQVGVQNWEQIRLGEFFSKFALERKPDVMFAVKGSIYISPFKPSPTPHSPPPTHTLHAPGGQVSRALVLLARKNRVYILVTLAPTLFLSHTPAGGIGKAKSTS